MVVTPLPMDTEVSPVQPEKAQSPMVVTLFGMVTTDNFVQLAYLQVVLYQLLVC